MPVSIHWVDPKQTILLYTFEGKWTWEEFRKLDDPMWDVIANADHRIDIIMDFTCMTQIPLGIQDIIHSTGNSATPLIEKGNIIVVSPSLIIKVLYGSFRRLYPQIAKIYYLVNTYEEATCLLEQKRNQSVSS